MHLISLMLNSQRATPAQVSTPLDPWVYFLSTLELDHEVQNEVDMSIHVSLRSPPTELRIPTMLPPTSSPCSPALSITHSINHGKMTS